MHNKKFGFSLIVGLVIILTGMNFAIAQDDSDTLVRNLDASNPPEGWVIPESVGHITNYLVHEWYQNLTAGKR